MRCPSCNYDNPADAAFCEGCGTKLELLCPACKAPISAGARFCKKCGAALRSTQPSAATVSASPTRSQITRSANTLQAVKYLQFAGEMAVQRSANIQAIEYLTKALVSLRTLPNDLTRARKELAMQIAIGPPLIAVKGYAASEVQAAYERSQILCDQLGERSQAFPIQFALSIFHLVRGQHQEAHEIAERMLETAEKSQEQSLLMVVCSAAGVSSFWMGELALARLLASQDRRDEARKILADIYNWFTEGFDTPDLKDAKSLPDELAT